MYMLKNKKDANIDKIIEGLEDNKLSLIEESIENNLEQGLLLEDTNIIEFRKKLGKISNMKFFNVWEWKCILCFYRKWKRKSRDNKGAITTL